MKVNTYNTKTDAEVKTSKSFFQPKLSVNAPGDSYEQEADAMADKVMRLKIPQKADKFFNQGISTIQRKCAACEEVQVHRKETFGTETQGNSELDKYVSSLSSSGQSLSESSRQFFEPRFGQDFSNVKIHTDSVAAQSAQSINALAYTTGNNIVFNQGQYSPNSESGQRLMAHELTHVVQQGENTIRKATGLKITDVRPDEDAEKQRTDAINILKTNAAAIKAAATRFNVPADSIAGAILWEALENPYHSFRPNNSRLGPGKVHPTEVWGKSEAEKVEDAGLVPASKDTDERTAKLKNTGTAITYIAAIMSRHAKNYLDIAGVDISKNVGVICTLYQGGHSEERAQKLKEKRKTDPNAQPQPGDEMGPWVVTNQAEIHKLIAP